MGFYAKQYANRWHSKNAVCSPAPLLVTNKGGWRRARRAPWARGKPCWVTGRGGRAVPEAVLGRSLGGARDARSRPAQGLDLSLSPPGAAAAPVVAPRFQKGPSDSSLGQSGAESWSPAQLPLVPEQDPCSPEVASNFPLSLVPRWLGDRGRRR